MYGYLQLRNLIGGLSLLRQNLAHPLDYFSTRAPKTKKQTHGLQNLPKNKSHGLQKA